ncbi:MAG: hypothetical protein AVDCRST_MAG08-4017, partial [uncultured Acetobacteraceae bacterium]
PGLTAKGSRRSTASAPPAWPTPRRRGRCATRCAPAASPASRAAAATAR